MALGGDPGLTAGTWDPSTVPTCSPCPASHSGATRPFEGWPLGRMPAQPACCQFAAGAGPPAVGPLPCLCTFVWGERTLLLPATWAHAAALFQNEDGGFWTRGPRSAKCLSMSRGEVGDRCHVGQCIFKILERVGQCLHEVE